MIKVTLSFNTVADAIAALREIPESVMAVAPAIVAGQPKPMNYEPAPLNPISEASDSLPQVEVRKPGRPKKIVSAEPEVAVVTPAVAPASPFSTSSDVVASPADEATVSAPVDPTPSPAPESTGAATEIDIETVREGLTRLHKRLGIDAVRKVLQRCKAGNVSGIDPKHYPKVMGWVQTMTAADLKKADE